MRSRKRLLFWVLLSVLVLAITAATAHAADICQQSFTYRLTKGSALTHAEADDNFRNANDLCDWIDAVSTCATAGQVLIGFDDDGDAVCDVPGDLICTDCVTLGTETAGNYALGDAEGGAATTGDSATGFFSLGTLEDARLSANVSLLGQSIAPAEMADADHGDVSWSGGVASVDADSVALGTDTTGGYAASSTEGGPATTATALAANGANCSAGNYPLGVDASGAVESCTAVSSGASPAGSGSEINARLDASTFQAVTGSSTANGGITVTSQSSGTPAVTAYSQGQSGPPSSGTTPSAGTALILRTSSVDYLGLDFGLDSSTTRAWIQSTSPNSFATTRTLAINPRGGGVGIGAIDNISASLSVKSTTTTAGGGIHIQALDNIPYGGLNIDASNDFFIWTRNSGGSNQTALTVDRDDGLLTMAGTWDAGDPGTRPTCDATVRGRYWHDFGGAGVADTVAVCAKSSGDVYAWHDLATIP